MNEEGWGHKTSIKLYTIYYKGHHDRKKQNQIVEKVEQVKTGLEQAEQEIEKAALSGIREAFLSRWLQVGLNWMLFFPVLLIERFTDYKVPRLLAFPLLAVAAFFGFYDILYGTLGNWIYAEAIDFSNQSLINSMSVLTVVKVGELLGFVPGVQAIGEIMQQIGDYLANGVLALGIQSIFMVLVKKGLFLKYLLGFGFLLLAVPVLADFGKKLIFGSLILFIIMPAVVYTEAFLYDRLTKPIKQELKTSYELIEGTIVIGGWSSIKKGAAVAVKLSADAVKEGAFAVKEGAVSLTSKVGDLFSSEDSSYIPAEEVEKVQEAEVTEEKPNQAGLLETIKNLSWAIINSLLLLFTITIMTCLVAPIVAYFLIFKLLREIFTQDYFEIMPQETNE